MAIFVSAWAIAVSGLAVVTAGAAVTGRASPRRGAAMVALAVIVDTLAWLWLTA